MKNLFVIQSISWMVSIILFSLDIKFLNKDFSINMLLILFQFEIFLVEDSHVFNMNELHKVRLHFDQLLVMLFFLIVRNDWDTVINLIPEWVNRVIQQNGFFQVSVQTSQIFNVRQSAIVFVDVVWVKTKLSIK